MLWYCAETGSVTGREQDLGSNDYPLSEYYDEQGYARNVGLDSRPESAASSTEFFRFEKETERERMQVQEAWLQARGAMRRVCAMNFRCIESIDVLT